MIKVQFLENVQYGLSAEFYVNYPMTNPIHDLDVLRYMEFNTE